MIDDVHDQETGELPAVIEGGGRGVVPPAPPLAPTLPLTPYDKIAAAVSSVMKEIAEDPVEKRGENKFHNYNFARMQDINQALTPLMAKHGLAISQSEVERSFLDNGSTVYATYEFTVLHSSGQRWPTTLRQTGMSRVRDSKGGFDDKALNKCHTSARKFFLTAFFQIPTKDDDDDVRRHRPQAGNARTPLAPAGDIAQGKGTAPQTGQAQPEQAQQPHELTNSKGETYLAWGERLMQRVLDSATVEEIDAWEASNKRILDLMKEGKPEIHKNITHSIKQQRGALAMK